MTFLNLAKDDMIYASLLLVSLFFGGVIRRQKSATQKQWISSGFGLSLVLIVCGVHTLHSLVTAFVNSLIIVFFHPR